jgi:hypothetical protein
MALTASHWLAAQVGKLSWSHRLGILVDACPKGVKGDALVSCKSNSHPPIGDELPPRPSSFRSHDWSAFQALDHSWGTSLGGVVDAATSYLLYTSAVLLRSRGQYSAHTVSTV